MSRPVSIRHTLMESAVMDSERLTPSDMLDRVGIPLSVSAFDVALTCSVTVAREHLRRQIHAGVVVAPGCDEIITNALLSLSVNVQAAHGTDVFLLESLMMKSCDESPSLGAALEASATRVGMSKNGVIGLWLSAIKGPMEGRQSQSAPPPKVETIDRGAIVPRRGDKPALIRLASHPRVKAWAPAAAGFVLVGVASLFLQAQPARDYRIIYLEDGHAGGFVDAPRPSAPTLTPNPEFAGPKK